MYLHHNRPGYCIDRNQPLEPGSGNPSVLYEDDDLSHLDVTKSRNLANGCNTVSSVDSEEQENESKGHPGNQRFRSSRRYGRMFCQCFEPNRWRFYWHITFECIKLAIRQRSTLFVLLLVLDFTFNTLMFYYEYVYIMVDVDVRHVDGSSPFHHLWAPSDDDEAYHKHEAKTTTTTSTTTTTTTTTTTPEPSLTTTISTIFTASTTATPTEISTPSSTVAPTTITTQKPKQKQKQQSKADLDAQNSISFTDPTDQMDTRSYQYEVNLIVYITIYASQINGFYAYIWSKHGWLNLYLIIVCIQLVFLLFLLMINLHLVIVYLFRLMLFFMSLHKSLTISDYQMIVQQRRLNQQQFNGNHGIPIVQIDTPDDDDDNRTIISLEDDINGNITRRKSFGKRMSNASYDEWLWASNQRGDRRSQNHVSHKRHPRTKHTSTVTVSNQDGQEIGIITLSSELESHDRGPLISTTKTIINYSPNASSTNVTQPPQQPQPFTGQLCRVLPSIRKTGVARTAPLTPPAVVLPIKRQYKNDDETK